MRSLQALAVVGECAAVLLSRLPGNSQYACCKVMAAVSEARSLRKPPSTKACCLLVASCGR